MDQFLEAAIRMIFVLEMKETKIFVTATYFLITFTKTIFHGIAKLCKGFVEAKIIHPNSNVNSGKFSKYSSSNELKKSMLIVIYS
jgi:hypothetical protein